MKKLLLASVVSATFAVPRTDAPEIEQRTTI